MPIPELPGLKLPSLSLPNIRPMPHIPGVGCVASDGHSYIGEQFGNLPDFQAVQAIRQLQKVINEQIAALIEGYLPTAARQPLWAARVVVLTQYVADLNSLLIEVVGRATTEIGATVDFINGKKSEVQGALNVIAAIPESARTTTQRLMAARYQEYLGELDAQVTRLQSTLGCLGG